MENTRKRFHIFYPIEDAHLRKMDLEAGASANETEVSIINENELSFEIECESEIKAKSIVERLITAKTLNDVWLVEDTIDTLVEEFSKNLSHFSNYTHLPYRMNVESHGKKFTRKEKLEIISRFAKLIPGKVNLSEPQLIISIFIKCKQNHSQKDQSRVIEKVWLSREICQGARTLIGSFDLKQRKYIGTTSMPAFYSFIIANQALADERSLILDPFCGTGSLLVSCSYFGSFVVGMDIDVRVLRGRNREFKEKEQINVFSNFDSYKLHNNGVDFCRTDFSLINDSFHGDNVFDAIVCDPPYGFRESSAKIGRKEYKKVPKEYENVHIPSRVQYSPSELFSDMLNFAARTLKMNGRIVYWLTEMPGNRNLPHHPSLEIVNHAVDAMNQRVHRRLITMKKVKEYVYEQCKIELPNLREEYRKKKKEETTKLEKIQL